MVVDVLRLPWKLGSFACEYHGLSTKGHFLSNQHGSGTRAFTAYFRLYGAWFQAPRQLWGVYGKVECSDLVYWVAVKEFHVTYHSRDMY